MEFDAIAEVTTDKLFTSLTSPYNGKIHKLLYEEDEACNIGETLI